MSSSREHPSRWPPRREIVMDDARECGLSPTDQILRFAIKSYASYQM